MKLISVKKTKAPKKYEAIFSDGKRVQFGAAGYSDYTMHKDKKRRELYRKRHAHHDINNPTTPAALSWYLLWGPSTSFDNNLKRFRARFRL
jgi:hypothetical protein